MPFEVGLSGIHGRGVFARRRIKKDERIGRYVSRKTERDGTYVLWLEVKGTWRGYDGYGRLRYLNHCQSANSEFKGLNLFALRTIRSGEEITIDYGDEWADVA